MNHTEFDSLASDPVVGLRGGSQASLQKVARYQKVILLCILIYFTALVGQFALPPDLRPWLGLGVLGLGVVNATFVILLALQLYDTVSGLLLGILCLIPILGLIILMIVNSKATDILQKNGIPVGLLGAKIPVN